MHGDEVGLAHELVEGHEAHADLRCPSRLHIGVVGDEGHAEGRESLGDEHADAAEADDADGLLGELHAVVLRALPLTVLEGEVRRHDVACGGEQQGDGELGRAHDVGGRCIDDHDARLGGRLHVDVVEAHAGAGDDLELLARSDRLGIHLGGRADEDRIGVGQCRQERRAIRAVAVPDLEVRAKSLDGRGRQLLGDEDDGLGHGAPRLIAGSGVVSLATHEFRRLPAVATP